MGQCLTGCVTAHYFTKERKFCCSSKWIMHVTVERRNMDRQGKAWVDYCHEYQLEMKESSGIVWLKHDEIDRAVLDEALYDSEVEGIGADGHGMGRFLLRYLKKQRCFPNDYMGGE